MPQNAFTLIEVLVATSVLTLTVVMLSAILNSASLTVGLSSKRLAADDQARQVFDLMQADFSRMLKRNDVYFQFLKQAGNDQFTFYSETPGYFPGAVASANQSNLSLVNYQCNSSYQLCRLGQGCQWSDISFTGTAPTFSTSNLHVLSSSIFRFESAFLWRTSDTTLQITATPPTPGGSFQNLEAIIVAVAVLDSNSQKLVNPTAYPSLINALKDYTGTQTISLSLASPPASPPVAATIDPILSTWQTAINTPGFAATAGIPVAAAKQIRVYQRIIYLQ